MIGTSESYTIYFCFSVGQDMAHTIAKDGTRTENISDRHRPSVLKERYSHLSFQRASDLKTQILKPDDMSKPEWTKFLNGLFCAIFMVNIINAIVVFHFIRLF